MSTALEAASLIMVPSGYDNGVLGSVKPTDGTGDFTFSRGSDTSATRVNEQGYIEKWHENLLLQSNSFDTTWNNTTSGNYIVTGGQTGYDNSNDAWLLNKQNTNNQYVSQAVSVSGVYTASIYAKKGSADALMIYCVGGYARFSLNDGSIIGAGANPIQTKTEYVGNGWYKCIVTGLGTTTYSLQIWSTITGYTTGSIYIQDAMLNQGLVAYPYIETTTVPVAVGILEDMPRIDHSSGKPSLLLEPERTNGISYSEYVSGANFSIGDFISSPEGVANGVGFIPLASTTSHYISTVAGGLTIANSSIVFSFYVKEGTQPYLRGRFDENSFTKRCFFGIDLTDNSVLKSGTGSSNVEITFEDSINGWKRVIFTATYDATPTGNGIAIFLGSGDQMGTDIDTYAGDGSTFFHIYGLQCEQGSYPTSYIPTNGASQTRLADKAIASNVASLLSETEGTLYLEVKSFPDNQSLFTISDGSIANRIGFYYQNGEDLRCNIRINGVQTNISGGGSISDAFYKVALTYDNATSLLKMYVNGFLINSASYSGVITSTLNTIDFAQGNGVANARGAYNQALVFPTALSDDECIELTTI